MTHRYLWISSIFLCLGGMASCRQEPMPAEGSAWQVRYAIKSYSQPERLRLIKAQKHWVLELSPSSEAVTLQTNPNEFKRLALLHGEDGSQVFKMSNPPTQLFYGIRSIEVFGWQGETWRDISHTSLIAFETDKERIPKYQTLNLSTEVRMMAKDLSASELMWLPSLCRVVPPDDSQRILLRLNLEDGRVLEVQS